MTLFDKFFAGQNKDKILNKVKICQNFVFIQNLFQKTNFFFIYVIFEQL